MPSLTGKGHIEALDSLRGIAVLAVLLGHLDYFFFGAGFDLFPGGFIGVDLFFVLSGFLITRNLLGELRATGRLRLGRFYGHRALRLLPALLLLLLVLLPTLWMAELVTPQVLRDAFLAILFYLFNWYIYFTLENVPGTGHLWSLSVEEQFYLLWPLLLLLVPAVTPRGRRAWCFICIGVVFAVAILRARGWSSGDSWLLLYLRTDLRADALLLGAVLAFLPASIFKRRIPTPLVYFGLGGWLAGLFLLSNEGAYMYLGGFTVVALLSTLLVLLAIAGNLGQGIAPLNYLGRISYGVYLYHMPIVLALASPVAQQYIAGEGLRLMVAALLSFAVAAISYRYIEAPILALKRSTSSSGV